MTYQSYRQLKLKIISLWVFSASLYLLSFMELKRKIPKEKQKMFTNYIKIMLTLILNSFKLFKCYIL